MNTPLVTVIIVAGTNRKKELVRCLKTLYDSTYKNIEVVLVDNSESPKLVPFVLQRFPDVLCIRMPENTGIFGYNVGFAHAQGTYCLILDDDCTVQRDSIMNAVRAFESKPTDVAVLTAKIYNPVIKSFQTQLYTDRGYVDIPLFSGASIFRTDVLRKVGYFDASFFCWQHELDLSLRILAAGYKIQYEETCVIIHPKGVEFRPMLHYYISRNETWLAVKHFSFPYLELLLLKNLVVVMLLPFKYKNMKALWHGVHGYIDGCISIGPALKKRKVLPQHIQRRFFRFHVLGTNES